MNREQLKKLSDADLASRYKEVLTRSLNEDLASEVETTEMEILYRWMYEQGVDIGI